MKKTRTPFLDSDGKPEKCVLYDRECIGCGECQFCDLDPLKICDNCGKCLEMNDYASYAIDSIDGVKLPTRKNSVDIDKDCNDDGDDCDCNKGDCDCNDDGDDCDCNDDCDDDCDCGDCKNGKTHG